MSSNNRKPFELLVPAGSPEALSAAIGEGADAVYLGLKDFNARIRAKNFSYNQFEAIVDKLHGMNKRIYVTLNTVFEEREAPQIYNLLKYLSLVKPDAIIVQDTGIINMCSKFFPEINVHASTQMNISSAEGLNFLSRYNVKRVVLSRELDLTQIKQIKANSSAEIEIFAHGALCVCTSGLCLFSSYFGGKSANRGRCTQACRRYYSNGTGEKSGYYFSLNDLMLIKYIPDIISAGVNSIKIEGRMKSYQYIAAVTKAYRYMIDNCFDDYERALEVSLEILKNDFARKKTEYLFVDPLNKKILTKDGSGQTGIYLGKAIKNKTKASKNYFAIKNSQNIGVNDSVRIQSAEDKNRSTLKIKDIMLEADIVWIESGEHQINPGDEVYLINKHIFESKYQSIIPNNLSKYRRHPGIQQVPQLPQTKMKPLPLLPEGFYVKVGDPKDLYIVQSDKPTRVIAHTNKLNYEELFSTVYRTGFSAANVLIYLEPIFNQYDEDWLKNTCDYFISKGYTNIIVNNLAQLNILRNKDVNVIAGPYLYTFNSYAINLLKENKIRHFIAPYENSKKNLLLSTEKVNKDDALITVFAYPELFQISSKLDFEGKVLTDNLNKYNFFITDTRSKISILPESPFCISDKIPELKKKGFSRFIIDIAYSGITKGIYKDLIKTIKDSKLIEKSSRFNWKEGFFFDKKESAAVKSDDLNLD